MTAQRERIEIGNCAGHHFHGQADMEVVYHCRRGTSPASPILYYARGEAELDGYYHVRTRLVDRAAFDYDPRLGWETDRWFEWPDGQE